MQKEAVPSVATPLPIKPSAFPRTIVRIGVLVCLIRMSQLVAVAQSQTPQTPSSPQTGVTSGTSPIETTLFAYRALASDVEAISNEVADQAQNKKVVIGTTTDIAAFTQWRSIMGEAMLLDERAEQLHIYLQVPFTDLLPLAPPTLSVSMTHQIASIAWMGNVPSVTLKYAIKVTNSRAASPTNGTVTVAETVPSNWKATFAPENTAAGWLCDSTNFTCTRTDALAPGANYPNIIVTLQPASNSYTPLPINGATVSGGGGTGASTSDPDPTPLPLLSITQSHPGLLVPGGDALFIVKVTNAASPIGGPTTGGLVTVKDVPTGISVQDMTGIGWACPKGTLMCTTTDPLAPGASYPDITIKAKVLAEKTAEDYGIANSVTVEGGGSLIPSMPVVDPPTPNLTISESAPTTDGQTVTYAVYVSNALAATPTSTNGQLVTVKDTQNSGLNNVILSADVPWTCNSRDTCTTTAPPLPDGTYPPITVTAMLANPGQSPSNTVSLYLGSQQNPPTVTATQPVTGSPKLSITEMPPGNMLSGQTVVYTVTVTNIGTAATNGTVTVKDIPSPGLQLMSLSPPAGSVWNCPPAGTSCTTTDPLKPGTSYPITATLMVNQPRASNHMTVTGGGSPQDSVVDPPLEITERSTPEGQVVRYHITVTNVSNHDFTPPTSQVVTATDLPTNLILLGVSAPSLWVCEAATATKITCTTSATLQAGQNYPEIIVTTTATNPPAATSSNTVTVQIGTAQSDTNTGSQSRPVPRGGFNAIAPNPPGAAPAGAAAPSPAPATAGGLLSTITGAIPSFSSLATSAATLLQQAFAVTQTLSPYQNNLTDAPLINMMARQLRHYGVPAYVPSVYTPNLLRNGNLEDTYIWQELVALEQHRAQLWLDVAQGSGNLSEAQFVIQNATKYTATDVNKAEIYAGQMQSLIASAQAVANSIDSFEVSLFGGQTTAQSTNPGTQQNANNQGNNTQTAGTQGNPSNQQTPGAPPAQQTPATQNNNNSQQNTNNNQNPNAQQTPGGQQNSQNQSGSTSPAQSVLPQILVSDLLAHSIWDDSQSWKHSVDDLRKFREKLETVNFLTVHALESGGSQLNKSNFFYGTHIFFSGGAVMTFALYNVSGDVTCSGFAYNYRGNVREKNYERVLHSPQLEPAELNTDFGCDDRGSVPARSIHPGMTAAQVIRFAGKPHGTGAVEKTKDVITWKYADLEVVFKKDKVIKVRTIGNNNRYYLIAFKNHAIQAAKAYKVDGDEFHWITQEGQEMQAPLSSVDIEFSQQINRDRNVEFPIP
jgi:uncharacterized repeat protein (TIGR01451 family)